MTKDFAHPIHLPAAAKAKGKTRVEQLHDKADGKRAKFDLASTIVPLILVMVLCASVALPFTIAGQEGMRWVKNLAIQHSIDASRQSLMKSAGLAIDDVFAPAKDSGTRMQLTFRFNPNIPSTAFAAYTSRTDTAIASPSLMRSGIDTLFGARRPFGSGHKFTASNPTPGVSRDVADAVAAIGRQPGRKRDNGFAIANPEQVATPIARIGDYRTLLSSAMPKLKNLSAPAFVPDAAAAAQLRPAIDATPQAPQKRVENEADAPAPASPRAAVEPGAASSSSMEGSG